MEMELGVRMGSVVGDGVGGIGEGERCIMGVDLAFLWMGEMNS